MSTIAYNEFEQKMAADPALLSKLANAPDRPSFVHLFLELGRAHGYELRAKDVELGIDEDIALARQEVDEADIVNGEWLYKGRGTSTSNYTCCSGSCS